MPFAAVYDVVAAVAVVVVVLLLAKFPLVVLITGEAATKVAAGCVYQLG